MIINLLLAIGFCLACYGALCFIVWVMMKHELIFMKVCCALAWVVAVAIAYTMVKAARLQFGL